jgi:hypothetical protein
MLSRLLPLAATGCSFLFVALLALWMRSHYIPDTFTRTSVTSRPDASVVCRMTQLIFAGGECRLSIDEHDFDPAWVRRMPIRLKPQPLRWQHDVYYDSMPGFFRGRRPAVRWLGFAYLKFQRSTALGGFGPRATQRITITLAKAPLWMLLVVLAILPCTWLLHRRLRRPRPGICATCGYDLRASNNRCPECGSPIPAT